MIEQMKGILAACAGRGESIPLHQLIWTVDARHHAIPTTNEINQALESVRAFRVVRDRNSVHLMPESTASSDIVTEADLQLAMKNYEKEIGESSP